MSTLQELVNRLRTAGVEPGDSEEVRIQKSLLMFAMGLTTMAPVVWLVVYSALGAKVSATVPFTYQLVSLGTLVLYLVTRNFGLFRLLQLSLYLFFPFYLQWTMGNFITSSGVVLWGLLAPVGAILVYSARDSIPWFVAYIALIALSAFFDHQLADSVTATAVQIPTEASVVIFALNFAAMSSLVYFMLRYASLEREKSNARLEDAHMKLKIEQERSERLLLNILPGPIAERLKQQDGTIADGFADVTVMFADIVNFTTIAEGMSPNQIFAMLNKVFSTFDALADKHGLEKIKTIGDAYMVAGGLNNDDHDYSEAIAQMALDMNEALANEGLINGQHLQLRAGIGTGPVVAGVVGKKKFIYDLWGDTVNIASRITGEGDPGNVHVDATTFRRLRNKFDFDPPRTVHLKGKGDTPVYRLIGRKAASKQAVA